MHGSGGSNIPIDSPDVLGTASSVKYRVSTSDNSESYILVKIFVAFSPNAQPEIRAVQKEQVNVNSPLEFNDSLLRTEGDCTPVEPVQPQPVVPRRPLGGHSNARIPTADEKDLLEADTLRVSI